VKQSTNYADAFAPFFAAFVILATIYGLAAPSPAADRGYTFDNLDRLAAELVPMLKARHGCPEDWEAWHGLEACRLAAAHKDMRAYERAGKAARRLWLLDGARD
jgi:thioesterase domain-containing protein